MKIVLYLLPLLLAFTSRSQDCDKEALDALPAGLVKREISAILSDADASPSRKRILSTHSYSQATSPQKGDSLLIGHKGTHATLLTSRFDSSGHRYSFYDKSPYIAEIDGACVFGEDGGLPARQYKRVALFWKGKKISVPPQALKNLFQPSLPNTELWLSRDGKRCYLLSRNSDGAGSYAIVWIFVEGKYLRRIVDQCPLGQC